MLDPSTLIFSREGPSDEDEKKKGKKKKGKKNNDGEQQDQRGLKTTSLGEAIMIWQDKFSRLLLEKLCFRHFFYSSMNKNMDKHQLKTLLLEGKVLNFKSFLATFIDPDFTGIAINLTRIYFFLVRAKFFLKINWENIEGYYILSYIRQLEALLGAAYLDFIKLIIPVLFT